MKYLLSKNIIRTEYRITNPSKSQLLYSIGAHPGFNCPLLPNEKMEDYYLEFEKDSFKIRQLDEGLRNVSSKTLKLENNKLVLSPELFKNDALVFENSQIKTLKLASSKSTHSITLQCKSWPYFGIWTKKECNRFICLEPWQGIADSSASSDAFETKEGILLLNAKEEHLHSFSLTFS